jgi:hypothetical protein
MRIRRDHGTWRDSACSDASEGRLGVEGNKMPDGVDLPVKVPQVPGW